MGKETNVLKSLEESSISRRSLLKGLAAMGALGAVAGCSKDDGSDIIYGNTGGGLEGAIDPEDLSDLSSFDVAYATCPHNCGPGIRCVSKIWTKNGRIVRVTTDETTTDINGNVRDKNNWNDPRQLNCAKGHSYKYRVYHSGRLKYPLKQTKKRGDATGFVRISWQQAYNEVIRKHRAIYAKYGPAAIQAGSNNSSAGYWAAASRAVAPITSLGGTRGSFSDHSFHQYNYCYGMAGVPNSKSYSSNHIGSQIPAVAGGAIKNWVSFGTNSMSTNNTLSYPYLRSNQLAKELNPNFKHYVISPELCDTGVLNATDWVQIRNMTDSALIAGMIYHLIENTFNKDGSIKGNPLLDVNYIDTCVYGFFDSPEYWMENQYTKGSDTALGTDINENAGKIYLNKDTAKQEMDKWEKETGSWTIDKTTYTTRWKNKTDTSLYVYQEPIIKINSVPAGRSYASWIMGSDDRLTKAMYSATNNYTAKSYISDGKDKPRASLCSMTIGGTTPAYQADINSTKYYTKKDYMTPKTPEWAEKITGTPASVIRELAELYAKPENHPILTEWTGGLQKSENGVLTLFAIQTLFAITKTWGYSYGSTGGMYQSWASNPGQLGTVPTVENLPDIPKEPARNESNYPFLDQLISSSGSSNPTTPKISCKEHFNGLYFAFKGELDNNPDFKGFANPFWDGSTRYLNDDAGAKTQILYKREDDGSKYKTFTAEDGREYYDYVGREEGKPVYVGKRFYIGSAGTQLNQVANTNWAAEIMKALPLAGNNPDDPDTFCMAVFDIYMSPQAMLADYIFPMANTLEVVDNTSIGGLTFRRLPLATPLGEAKDAWEAAFIGWNEQSKIGNYNAERLDCATSYNKSIVADAGMSFVKLMSADKYKGSSYKSVNDLYKAEIEKVCQDSSSRFYGMSVNQAIAAQILPKEASEPVNITETTMSDLRKAVDSYLQTNMSEPFIYAEKDNNFSPAVYNAMAEFTTETAQAMPNQCGRMTCYAEYAVYTWEHAYDIYHGWLPADKRGQRNKDYENDPFIYPIPMYYAFEDTFNEMYGVFNTSSHDVQGGWLTVGPKPSSNDLSKITDKLTLTVGSTHDRYRSHSSQAENPYLREFTHRTKGGGWASCNDWNEYCVVPEIQATGSKGDYSPMISRAVANKDMSKASWHEFWMNDEDAAQFGIKDGDLIRVSNPVGAIRVIARVTKRIVRGHGQIHQGAWYDPNPVDKVDDGACANTIMSNRPSRFDNGNSVHCAYCIVEKETSF